jgi:hypothetical protein
MGIREEKPEEEKHCSQWVTQGKCDAGETCRRKHDERMKKKPVRPARQKNKQTKKKKSTRGASGTDPIIDAGAGAGAGGGSAAETIGDDAECNAVTDEELLICASVLKRLQPTQLNNHRIAEVTAAGKSLFKRTVLKDRLGERDAVEFLKDLHGQRELLKKLERLSKEIRKAHGERVEAALTCGINQQREQGMLHIAAGGPQGSNLLTNTPQPGMLEGSTRGPSITEEPAGDACSAPPATQESATTIESSALSVGQSETVDGSVTNISTKGA